MKMCPQCEFIYEDEQHLCDMDGTMLVYDSRILFRDSGASDKSFPRLFATVAMPVAVLAFLSVVAFRSEIAPRGVAGKLLSSPRIAAAAPTASIQSKNFSRVTPAASLQSGAEPRSVKGPASNQKSGMTISEANRPSTYIKDTPRDASSGAGSGRSASGSTGLPAPRAFRRIRPQASPKKDSGVGSFLKKTGKFLKRPFER